MSEYALFYDRQDAGEQLAKSLINYKNDPNTLILALPRGGVPVAYPVAKALQLPLDVFVVRKLGVPFNPELAMGAIASNEVEYLNHELIAELGISQHDIDKVIRKERAELERREQQYRQGLQFPSIKGKTIIIIDDGIATGATIHAGILALKKLSPKKIIVAVPVAPNDSLEKLETIVDEIICLHSPAIFYGVGMFYQNFSQTTDDEVYQLLRAQNHLSKKIIDSNNLL